MRKREREKFRKLLFEKRGSLLAKAATAQGDLELDPDDFPDEVDSASSESNLSFVGHLLERERGLLNKIAQAIEKLERGDYGECESCGEEIGLKRLEARPVAELCIDCKAEQEKLERRMG